MESVESIIKRHVPRIIGDYAESVIQPCDERLLRSLHRFHYLSSQQLCRLTYSRGSLTYVQSKLLKLTRYGFVQRTWLPRRINHGSSPAIYSLARKGMNHLKRLGVAPRQRIRPSEQSALSYLFLNHTLQLNDFLIGAEVFCRTSTNYQLHSFLHERELKRAPIDVIRDDGKSAVVVPDAWMDIRMRDRLQVCLVVELDCGTEEQKAWRRKVQNLLAFADGPYQDAFGTRSLTFVVVTTAGDRRLLQLLRWTEAELAAAREVAQGDLFILTSWRPELLPAQELFRDRRWLQPFGGEAVSLLDGAG